MQKQDLLQKFSFLKNPEMNQKMTINDYKREFVSNRKKEKENLKSWINSTFVIMLSLIVSLLLYYVWILNANATKWYNIRELEKERRSLLIEQETMKMKISEIESLKIIEEDMKDMERVENPDFIVIKKWEQYVYNN